MPHAIRIHATAAPRSCVWEEVEVGAPGPGEVRLRQTAVGLNFIDTYHRTGLYPLPELPAVLGREAAGVSRRSARASTEFAARRPRGLRARSPAPTPRDG